jgi:hypothetical protein
MPGGGFGGGFGGPGGSPGGGGMAVAPQQPQQPPMYPGTIDYAKAVTPGYSPVASAPMYGGGSPFTGPSNVFGGM